MIKKTPLSSGSSDSTPICFVLPFGTTAEGFPFIIGAVVLVAALVIYLIWRYEKKRTEQFREMAKDAGLPFFPKGDGSLRKRLEHFHLFSQGRCRKIRNMLHGETNDVELAVLDYRYTVGSGKHSRTYRQSVIYFCSPTLCLPHFALRPEVLFHKIGTAFGYQDIDFEDHPEFSSMYLLRGRDETSIREFFDDKLLAFFEAEKKISVEGGSDQIVFYRHKKRIRPEELHRFMDEGFRVFTLFNRKS